MTGIILKKLWTKYFDEFEEDEPFYPINNDNSKGKKYQKKDMCFVDFTYNREVDNNYRSNMVTALEVFDSLQESVKNINLKEGQSGTNSININNKGKNVKNSGSKNSIRSNGDKNNNANKNSFIINENVNVNVNNNIKININSNNIYSYENSKSNSKTKKKGNDNINTSKEKKPFIKINNNGVQNTKSKPINIFSNKSHYIPVSNNKSNVINSIKTNSKGKAIKKSNDMGKKIIAHPSSSSGNKPMNNSGILRKNVKVGSNINNNIPTGKIQINKIGKMTTASVLNKPKPVSAKNKK